MPELQKKINLIKLMKTKNWDSVVCNMGVNKAFETFSKKYNYLLIYQLILLPKVIENG